MITIKIHKVIIYCLFIFCSIITTNVLAQRVMPPTTISTPYGKSTINHPFSTTPYYAPIKLGKKKNEFRIVFLNDSTITVKSPISINDTIHAIVWGKKEKNIITPGDTKEIFYLAGGKEIRGVPGESCWYFLLNKGKINTYIVSPALDNQLVNYIQKGDTGKIIALTIPNVKELVSDNPEALSLANQGFVQKAIGKYNE